MNKTLLAFTLILSASLSFAEDKIIQLTSLDWPPYSSKSLDQQGASVAVAKEAFKAMGYQLKVDFFPWSRAIALAKDSSSDYAGYFPDYFSDENAKDFIYSAAMGSSPLGFAERKDKSINWTTLQDLKPYRIGVVQDYINAAEFDAMIANKTLKSSVTTTDEKNLKKLVGKRVDLAVVDKNVMNYLFKTNPSLANKASEAQFNSTLLENKKLFICFKKGPKGEDLAKIYNEGLKKIDIIAIMNKHL
jgi:polar amino acid transport system substrate-binding protein